MIETNLVKKIMLAVSKTGARIFRNNTGMGYQGKTARKNNVIIIKHPRVIHAGLCEGSSDLIGWTPVEITEDMVGSTIAVFTALEVKTKSGRASKKQLAFIRQVKEAGGIAGIARNEKEAIKLINQHE